jgi:hypothetical protein
MPTPDDVRGLALALPEAYEDTHRCKPAFRVNKRIFASPPTTSVCKADTGWDSRRHVRVFHLFRALAAQAGPAGLMSPQARLLLTTRGLRSWPLANGSQGGDIE